MTSLLTRWRELNKAAAIGERCPHCGAMHERGDDGTCNRCGKMHDIDKDVIFSVAGIGDGKGDPMEKDAIDNSLPYSRDTIEKAIIIRLHKAVRDVTAERREMLYGLQKKFAPSEPRIPAGEKGAGEWTTAGMNASAQPPKGVAFVLTSSLKIDVKRFQFKSNVNPITGVGDELKDVRKFDPELAGIVSVWRDPANARSYIVNGHHRFELARRHKVQRLVVRYIDAPSAERAMLKGALINIAEGRGTPVDAAKLFRQTKISRAQLEAAGLSLRGSLADSATSLAVLCPTLWHKVVSGAITPGRGAVIGKAFQREPEQLALNNMLERPDIKRKRLSDEAIGELAKFVDTAGRRAKTIDTLFGEESLVQNLAVEKAQVSAVLKARLSADRRLFGYVAQTGRATRLEAQGNVLATNRNQEISQQAAQTEAVYDKLSRFSGPISDALSQAAKEVANGVSISAAADRAYPKIREIVAGIATGRGEGHGGMAGGGNPGGTPEPNSAGDGGMFDWDKEPERTVARV